MTMRACQVCGAPFTPAGPTDRRCAVHAPVGRASRSPTTRAQDATYYRERARILAGYPTCHWCSAPAVTADHLIPVARGGGHIGNLVPACASCNYGRGAQLPPVA
jgi:5-methylcytosine-specific restriction endonuclease McrA